MPESTLESRAKQMGSQPNEELKQSYSALADYLKKLEAENKSLAKDLERKRTERAQREAARTQAGQQSQQRLDSMARTIDQTDEAARKQRAFLDRMQTFFTENEKRLAQIAGRIQAVSKAAPGEQTASVSALKADLVNMLGELKTMRRKREELLTGD